MKNIVMGQRKVVSTASPETGLIPVRYFVGWSLNSALEMVFKRFRKCKEGQEVSALQGIE